VLEQISDILYYGIIAFGLVLVLIEFGVQKSTILTLLVSVGITLGLSFQNILLKVFSGIYIIMMKLYDIGDSINVNSTTGQVVAFNLFNTTVRDQTKNIDIIIPNDIISDTELINYTRQSTSN
jgi:small conductance mechanosensitive channel